MGRKTCPTNNIVVLGEALHKRDITPTQINQTRTTQRAKKPSPLRNVALAKVRVGLQQDRISVRPLLS